MSGYDSMSVHELMLLASHDGAMQQHFKQKVPSDLPAIESALCRAVIREATVGKVEVRIRESEDELTAPVGDHNRIVTTSEQFICQQWIPEGKYLLVKKGEK